MYKKSRVTLDFDTLYKLRRGFYASASGLNPPTGSDCTHILRRSNGSYGWCDEDGNENGSRFTAIELNSDN